MWALAREVEALRLRVLGDTKATLDHVSGDDVSAVYDKYDLNNEKQEESRILKELRRIITRPT